MVARHGKRYSVCAMTNPSQFYRTRSEALLDAAVELTFPASDPISIDHAFRAAREQEDDSLNREPDAGAASRDPRQS